MRNIRSYAGSEDANSRFLYTSSVTFLLIMDRNYFFGVIVFNRLVADFVCHVFQAASNGTVILEKSVSTVYTS